MGAVPDLNIVKAAVLVGLDLKRREVELDPFSQWCNHGPLTVPAEYSNLLLQLFMAMQTML